MVFKDDQDFDDKLSEISMPEIDFSQRQKLLDQLARREKDREELELDSCFKQLASKAEGVDNDDIESMASQTMSEIKAGVNPNAVNIYKPNLRGNTPKGSARKMN